MRLEHLQYLVEIDNRRSITQAAKMLYTTQPALSAVVAGIERELGFQIFRRTKQGVSPTTKGEKVLSEARKILQYYNSWKKLDEHQGEIAGDIHVMTTPVVGRYYMTDIIAEMKNRHPKVQFYLNEILWSEALQVIAMRKSNIIFLSMPYENMEVLTALCRKNAYEFFELGNDPYRAIVSTQNPLSERPFLTSQDIQDIPFVMYGTPNDKLNDKLRALLPPGGQRFIVNSDAMIWPLVVRNLAISMGPLSDLKKSHYCEKGLIKVLPLQGLEHCLHHMLVYANSTIQTTTEREFIQVAREMTGGDPEGP